MPPVRRPGRRRQNGGDVLSPHAGNDDGVRLLRADIRQTVAQAEVDALRAVGPAGLSGPFQGALPQIAGNGRGHAPMEHQPHGQVGMVRANISELCILWDPVRQQPQPGRQFQVFCHVSILRQSV